MKCKNPYINKSGVPCPCGKCICCLINRLRTWQHRLILERSTHDEACFVTITYNEANTPKDGCVSVSESQRFLKRLRKAISPGRIRFYGVGEYGDQSLRPHYHYAIFGLGCLTDGQCNDRKKLILQANHHDPDNTSDCRRLYAHRLCRNCLRIESAWTKGFVDIGTLSTGRCGYIGGYILKKIVKEKEKIESLGLSPEFSHQSRNPPIGAPAMEEIIKHMKKPYGDCFKTEYGDVPVALKHGKSYYPLGRTLREYIRKNIDMPEAIDLHTGEVLNGPKTFSLQNYKAEVQEMFKDAKEANRYTKDAQVSLKHFLIEKNFVYGNDLEKRMKLYSKRKEI